MKYLRKYGHQPFNVAVIHGGPGAPGEAAPVARELSSIGGILEPLQTATTLEGQVQELKTVLEKNGALPVTLIGFSKRLSTHPVRKMRALSLDRPECQRRILSHPQK